MQRRNQNGRKLEPGNRREDGIALILALLVLTLLVIIVFQLAYSTKVDLRLAKNQLDTTVLSYATDGVVARAKAYLAADSAENNWDAPGDLWESASFAADEGMEDYDYSADPWADEDQETEGRVELEVIIVDEERKLNLTMLAERPQDQQANNNNNRNNRNNRDGEGNQNQNQNQGNQPQNKAEEKKKRERYFDALIHILVEFRDGTPYDLTGTEAREIAEEIRDYVTRPAETNTGDGDIPHPDTTDRPMLTVDELLMLDSVTEDLLFDFIDEDDEETVVPGLLNFVTIWSSGLININTGLPTVLRSIFEKDKRDVADEILDYRDEYEEPDEDFDERSRTEPESGSQEAETPGIFKDVSELQSNSILDNEDYQDILPFISTQSTVFSVYVIAKRGKVERRTRVVLRRINNDVYPLFYETRKDKLMFGRDLEDEDDEGGFFF